MSGDKREREERERDKEKKKAGWITIIWGIKLQQNTTSGTNDSYQPNERGNTQTHKTCGVCY